MKPIILVILVAFTIAFYFGYGPSDLILLFQPKPSVVAKPARQPAPEPASATPQTPNTTIIVASGSDGSLEHRWSPYPSASPTATVKR
jgi:hypothetical protein